jgi:alpha/beta superfamily hydrolase
MPGQPVTFPALGENPPTLEGELWTPDGPGPFAGVVVAHPHPLRGGSMNSNVVMGLGLGLAAAGIAWLRFNFRGVGASQGTHGEGAAEQDDVRGALAFLGTQPGIASDRIALAGYSFGARVSLAVAPRRPELKGLLCVAPPLREPLGPESRPSCPLLVLIGDRDPNVAEGVEPYAARLPDDAELRVVEGTDHFWWGFESILTEAAHEFFSQALLPPVARVP